VVSFIQQSLELRISK